MDGCDGYRLKRKRSPASEIILNGQELLNGDFSQEVRANKKVNVSQNTDSFNQVECRNVSQHGKLQTKVRVPMLMFIVESVFNGNTSTRTGTYQCCITRRYSISPELDGWQDTCVCVLGKG